MSEIKEKLVVSASPHFKSRTTTRDIMLDVIIALIPALIGACIIFGLRSLLLTAVSIVACVCFEYISRRIMKRHNTIGDLSAVVTGMLLAFNVPVEFPVWMLVIADFFAIVIAKQFFGGIGQNFVNPALVGRVVLIASFPSQMNTFMTPAICVKQSGVDAVTTATPLNQITSVITSDGNLDGLPDMLSMFLGIRGGVLGEVCIAGLLLGFIYLLIRKVISPAIPLCYMGTVAIIMLIASGSLKVTAYELMAGGLVLGAVFMATDYATSPISIRGKIIYAIGCGLITSLIRIFGNLAEGVSFSIIIMNILVPHIERLTTPKPFGTVKEKKEKEEAKDQ